MRYKHGAIYLFKPSGSFYMTEARCNISVYGDELWFTDKEGKEVYGKPSKLIRESDGTFKHNDVT